MSARRDSGVRLFEAECLLSLFFVYSSIQPSPQRDNAMTTIAPPKVKEFEPSTIEKIAYNSVKNIPTREPNDQYRLGYSIWIFLTEKRGTIELAVRNSGSRLLIPEQDAIATIKQELKKSGVEPI